MKRPCTKAGACAGAFHTFWRYLFMMHELLNFFLGAVHIFVTDPDILPVVDACGSLICCSLILGTACSLIIWSLRLVWIALFGGWRNV